MESRIDNLLEEVPPTIDNKVNHLEEEYEPYEYETDGDDWADTPNYEEYGEFEDRFHRERQVAFCTSKRKKKRVIPENESQLCDSDCKLKCYLKFNKDKRRKILRDTMNLGQKQISLFNNVHIDLNENRSLQHYLPSTAGNKIKVCEKFFETTLQCRFLVCPEEFRFWLRVIFY